MSKNKMFAVLGLGRFGQAIVKTLVNNGAEVLACDIDPEIVQDVAQYATHVVQADIRDRGALESLGLGNFDTVIVGVGNNLEAAILATIFAKEAGCNEVVVKTTDTFKKEVLERLGADIVVLPEKEMGEKVAYSLLRHNVIDMINLSDKYSIIEIKPLSKWIDTSIKKSSIRSTFGVTVIAMKRDKEIIVSPSPEEMIFAEDVLVIIGDNVDIHKLTSLE